MSKKSKRTSSSGDRMSISSVFQNMAIGGGVLPSGSGSSNGKKGSSSKKKNSRGKGGGDDQSQEEAVMEWKNEKDDTFGNGNESAFMDRDIGGSSSDDELDTNENGKKKKGSNKKKKGKEKFSRSKSSSNFSADDYESWISEAADNLTEQKPEIRLQACLNLLQILRGPQATEAGEYILDSYIDTLTVGIIKMLNKQTSSDKNAEGMKLLELISLLALLKGPNEDEFFTSFETVLTKLIECSSLGEVMQSKAMFTLSFLSFICGHVTTRKTWEYIEEVLCEGPDEITDLPYIEACRSWVLLATTMEDEEIMTKSKERVYSGMSRILHESDEIEDRIAAGQGLAFLYEIGDRLDSRGSFGGGEWDEYTKQLTEKLCARKVMGERTLTTLKDIVKESGKRLNKRDKKEQKAVFRIIDKWIFEGIAPEDSIRFSGATVVVRGFREASSLEALKQVLGNAFQSALRLYQVVADILDVGFLADADDGDGKDLKIRKGSKEDKKRDVGRKQDRKLAMEDGISPLSGDIDFADSGGNDDGFANFDPSDADIF